MDYYKRNNIKVIDIKVSEDEVRRRMKERGRSDDKDMEIVNTRIEWYNQNVLPTIEYLASQEQYNIITIDGEQDIEKVHQDIIEKLELANN